MAFIEYDELTAGAQYNAFRYEVMGAAWGAEKNPYLAGSLGPTIGTNLAMTTSFGDFQLIAESILGTVDRVTLGDLWTAVNRSYSKDTALRNALDGVLADHGISGRFAFPDNGHMKGVLNGFSTTATAESSLSISDFNTPVSEERAAVFSIAFEGVDVTPILSAMLLDGDRVEAWYEIRYDSNNDVEQTAAEKREVAARRYIQSDYFELYNDPGQVGYEEAFDVARGYQTNRNAILAYENRYDPAGAGKAADAAAAAGAGGSINDALQPAIAAVARHFGVAAGHLEEVLYVRGASPDLSGDGTAFDSRKNDDDLLVGDIRGNTIGGGAGNDLILGLGGNDKLDGGKDDDRLFGHSGNDVLQGAVGNDRLDGGADGDTLGGSDGNDWLYGNAGADTLDGGKGNDTLLGGNAGDQLTAGDGDDRLDAGYGDDKLDGGDGNDRLNGLDGKDKLDGGKGNDLLAGGNDADTLDGGAGNDTYVLGTDQPENTQPDPEPGPDPDPNPDQTATGGSNDDAIVLLAGGSNGDTIVEDNNGGTDTVLIGVAGSFNLKNVENLRLTGNVSGNVAVTLNQFDRFTLSDKADTLTLTINKLQKDAIDIVTGGGADTVRINLAAGVDPSQVLDHKGLTARFDFADLSASDTIDLTSIGIKKIVTGDLDISQDSGFYLMAPDTKIHLMDGGSETKTYNNDTNSWFVVKCGDNTPYGPEFIGHVTKDNFDI